MNIHRKDTDSRNHQSEWKRNEEDVYSRKRDEKKNKIYEYDYCNNALTNFE